MNECDSFHLCNMKFINKYRNFVLCRYYKRTT